MTTCPMCDDISVKRYEVYSLPDEKPFHVNCKCGWAWQHSSYCLTKAEAKATWERYMRLRALHEKKEPMQ